MNGQLDTQPHHGPRAERSHAVELGQRQLAELVPHVPLGVAAAQRVAFGANLQILKQDITFQVQIVETRRLQALWVDLIQQPLPHRVSRPHGGLGQLGVHRVRHRFAREVKVRLLPVRHHVGFEQAVDEGLRPCIHLFRLT